MVRGLVISLMIAGLAMGQAMVQHSAAAAGGAAAAAGSAKIAVGLEKILGSAASATAKAAETPKPAVTTVPKKEVVLAPVAPVNGKRSKHSPFEPQVTRAGGTEMTPAVDAGMRVGIPSPSEVDANGGVSVSSGEAAAGNQWVSKGGGRARQQAPVPAFTPFVTNDAPVANRGVRRSVFDEQEAGGVPAAEVSRVSTGVSTIAVVPVVMPPVEVVPPPPPPVLATPEKFAEIQKGATYEQILLSLGTPASKIEMIEGGNVLESLRIEARGNKIGTIRMVNGSVTSVEPVNQ